MLSNSRESGKSGKLFMPDINMRKMSGNEKMLPDLGFRQLAINKIPGY
jgi:hypothetical protein